MAHYRQVGEVPPKRHTPVPPSRRRAVRRGADGGGGLLRRLLAALPPRHPVGAGRRPAVGAARPGADAERAAAAAAPEAARPVPRRGARRRPTRSPAGGWCWATPTSASPTRCRRRPSPLYRNAVGDECVYVERGDGDGRDGVRRARGRPGRLRRPAAGDDAPLGADRATSRCAPTRSRPTATSPRRSATCPSYGQFLEHAPYCERDLRGPAEPLLAEGTDVEVYVKHRGDGPGGLAGTVHVVPEHPFDVVGWDGCLYPYAFNVADFEPITGRVHQPPPVHQVFEGQNFVICNFVPRKVDYHPLAVPVPYYHSNVDSDEVMFYVDGDYEARKGSGIGKGSISLHPGGHSHGPQPGAVEARWAPSSSTSSPSWSTPSGRWRWARAARAVDDGRVRLVLVGPRPRVTARPAAEPASARPTCRTGSSPARRRRPRTGVAIGDAVLDLAGSPGTPCTRTGSLNEFLARGPAAWRALRRRGRPAGSPTPARSRRTCSGWPR